MDFIAWTHSVAASNDEYERTSTDSRTLALVRSRLRPGREHTRDLRVTCGGRDDHDTKYRVRLRIREGRLVPEHRAPEGQTSVGMQHTNAASSDVTITCPECGVRVKLSQVTALKAALRALSVRDRHNQVIPLRERPPR